MTPTNPGPAPSQLRAIPPSGPRKPSLTRATSSRASRLREEALKGNPRAMRHGVFATVSAWSDVAVEITLIYATHPGLDALADRRLVEQLALASVLHRRAAIAIDTAGMDPPLTAYESRTSALVERLERAVHERNQERTKARQAGEIASLDRYRPVVRGDAS